MDSCGHHEAARYRFCSSIDNNNNSNNSSECPRWETQAGGSCALDTCTCECKVWSDWSPWSGCDCNNDMHTRSRTCSEPVELMCPNWQKLADVESKPCDSKECCCTKWASWHPWAQCSVPCGKGTSLRERFCDNPRDGMCDFETDTKSCAKDNCDCPGCHCLDYSVAAEQMKNCMNLCESQANLENTADCKVRLLP